MPKKILIVDDEEKILRLYRRIFGKSGHSLTFAQKVGEALELLEKESYDLIITDFDLGDGTGVDIIKKARTLTPGTRVVLATGSLSEEAMESYNVDYYLKKPFNSIVFLEKIKEMLS